jgi:hypothetical protein
MRRVSKQPTDEKKTLLFYAAMEVDLMAGFAAKSGG